MWGSVACGGAAGRRALPLLILLTTLVACADNRVVEVRVVDLPTGAASLAIDAALPPYSTQSTLQVEASRSLDFFRLRLPSSAAGPLRLRVQALGPDRCPLADGERLIELPPAPLPLQTVSVDPRQRRGCNLDVARIGDGEGVVRGGKIDCGTTCSAALIRDQEIELHPEPAAGSTFAGWSGACTGTAPCRVKMDAPLRRVEAAFIRRQVCNGDGWCWLNPLPRGTSLNAVWAQSGSDAWAVGDDGLALRWNGSFWVPYPLPITEPLTDVYGTASGDVFAVGGSGAILHFDGQAWQREAAPPGGRGLGGVRSCGGRLFALGRQQIIVRGPEGWSVAVEGAPELVAMACAADGTLWLAEQRSYLHRLEGSRESGWRLLREQAEAGFVASSLWASADGQLWLGGAAAGGQSRVLRRSTSGRWSPLTLPSDESPPRVLVYGTSADDVWITAGETLLLRVRGDRIEPFRLDSPMSLSALAGTGGDNIWAVGEGGAILRWNGVRWQNQRGDNFHALHGLWADDRGQVIAVGRDGPLLRWDGERIRTESQPIAMAFRSVWGVGRDYAIVAGIGRSTAVWDGADWNITNNYVIGNRSCIIHSVFGGVGRLFGTGICSDGLVSTHVVLRFDTETPLRPGTSESVDVADLGDVGSPAPLRLWGSRADDMWAVGTAGSVRRFDGTAWRSVATGVVGIGAANLTALWGSGPGDIWLGGTTDEPQAMLVRYQNGTFRRVPAPGGLRYISSIWGSGPDDVWLVGAGDNGSVVRWDGASFTAQGPVNSMIHAIWGRGREDLWVGGEGGALLHYDRRGRR